MTDAHSTDPPRRWITGQALLRNEAGAVLLAEGAGPAPSRRWHSAMTVRLELPVTNALVVSDPSAPPPAEALF